MTLKSTCALAGGLAAAVIGSAAAPADPLAVRVSGSVPFTSNELESALALRAELATPEAARPLVASVDGDGPRVRIAVTGRERVMDLADEDGADAARLVAFAILDLAGDQLDPPAGEARVASLAIAPANDGENPFAPHDDGGRAAPRPDAHRPRWSAAVWGAAGTRREAMVEFGVPIAGRYRAFVGGGIALRETTTVGAASVSVRAAPVRLGVAWRGPTGRLGGPELRLGAIGVIDSASADRSSTDVLFGGGAAVLWAMPLPFDFAPRRGVSVLAGGGVDGFVTARDYRVDGAQVATTDRVAWWAGLAISAEVWR